MLSFGKSKHSVPWLKTALLIALVCSIANFFLNDKIGTDTSAYYARMAGQFGEGNYNRAFFHSIPPFVPVLAGLFCKLGLSAWQSLKLVSGIFFIVSVYWSYRLGKLRLKPEKAQWCAMLYVCCSRLLRYGMAGQLEGAKMFFVLLAFEQALRFIHDRHWKNLAVSGLACSLLALSRTEGVISIPLVCFLIILYPLVCSRNLHWSKRIMNGVLPCVVLLMLCFIVWTPWIVYQYKVTGYPSISSKLSVVFENAFHLEKSAVTRANEEHINKVALLRAVNPVTPDPVSSKQPGFLQRFREAKIGSVPFKIIETYKGLIPYLFVPALAGAWLLFKRRKWSFTDTAFAIAFPGHLLLLWLFAPSILKRLIVPYVPFYFVWCVIAYEALFAYTAARISDSGMVKLRIRLPRLACLLILIAVWDGMSSVRKTLRGKEKTVVEIAHWIRQKAETLDVNKEGVLDSSMAPWGYHNGSDVVIASTSPQIAGLAQTDWCMLGAYPGESMSHAQIFELLQEYNVDILVVDEDYERIFHRFEVESAGFTLLSDTWKEHGILIFGFMSDRRSNEGSI